MNILAVIPARGGSKGIPGKNIKLLVGKPLLTYTAQVAQQAKCFTKVSLTTDDDAIIALGRELNLEIPYKRPAYLAQDDTPTLPVIQHLLQFYQDQNITFDAVCLLQTTSPFRTVEWLQKAVASFIEKGTDSLISVQEVPKEYNPHWTFERDENDNLKIATGEAEIISRRQDLPNAYHRDGLLYLTKVDVILNQNSLYGNTISYYLSESETYVNIDTLEDWEKAEAIIERKQQ